MDTLLQLFMALHVVSFILSTITWFVLGFQETPLAISQRILRVFCVLINLIGFVILLPGLLYSFQTEQISPVVCWTQGLVLHYCFLMAHTIVAIISIHNWILIVKWDFEAAKKYEKIYWMSMILVPLSIVVTTVIVSGATSNWWSHPTDLAGITSRPAYCFWNRPYWIKLVGYVVPYAIATLLQAGFSGKQPNCYLN